MSGNNGAIKKVSIVCSKGSLEGVYPALIMANGARMEGIEASLFFTFFGLDAVTKKKMHKIKVATVGNPSMGMPTFVGGLPFMQGIGTSMMKKKIDELDLPPIRELIETLDDSGAELYACQMAADMMDIKKEDLLPQIKDIITAMDFIDLSEGAQTIFV